MSATSHAVTEVTCARCEGTGYLNRARDYDDPCPDCHATGKRPIRPERRFRVLWQASRKETVALDAAGCPRDVPWSLLAPHEAQALRNHDQTLRQLNERGGLGVAEMVAVIDGKSWSSIRGISDVALVPRLLELIAQHEARR